MINELEQIAIGDLPENWRFIPLGEFCDFKGGTQPPKSTFLYEPRSGYVRLLQIRDFESDDYATYVQESPRLSRVDTDDVSIARYGASVGRVLTGKKGVLNVAIMTTLPDESIVTKKFLYYALQHQQFYRYLSGLGGRAAQAGFNKGEISRFRFPVPPLPEQQKIAHILSTVQRAIETQERIIATTTELKKTLMQKLFTEGLRGERQKETEIGSVPESWGVVPLGSLAKIGNGSTPKRDNDDYWRGGKTPWLNSAKIHDLFITEANQFITDLAIKECHLPRVSAGSLLIAITGQGKTLGNTALVNFETCINQHLAYAQFSSARVTPDFILWFMQTRYEHLRSIGAAGGSTKGALTCGYLKTYAIPVPSIEEQQEIANVFATLDRKMKNHKSKRLMLTSVFRTLLHELMTGKTSVCELELVTLGITIHA